MTYTYRYRFITLLIALVVPRCAGFFSLPLCWLSWYCGRWGSRGVVLGGSVLVFVLGVLGGDIIVVMVSG